jgi:hypothetical protein
MSKWTEVRDGLEAALDVKEVAETAKNEMIASLTGEGMDALEAVADKFTAQIQEQANSETGWNMIRDKFVLPLLINGIIWAVKLTLSKSTNTAPQ